MNPQLMLVGGPLWCKGRCGVQARAPVGIYCPAPPALRVAHLGAHS